MTALAKCYYEVPGVKRNATEDEIKKEYKELALQVHPAQGTKPDSNRAQPTTPKQNPTESSNDEPRFYSCEFSCEQFPAEAIVAIKDLTDNFLYNQVTIRARATHKSDIRRWSNADGEGTLFRMNLLDDSGEIRMTGFNTSVDSFYDMIQVNHVYYIRWFTVKPANKKFTSIKHDYEISCSKHTQVKLCEKDTSDIPQATYNFVPLFDIEHVDAGKTIDVIGVCKSVGHCQDITPRKTGKKVKKRELVLIDHTCKEIVLTLWRETAEDFSGDTQPIIAVKGVQVSDFGGKSISCLSSSLLKVNPDLRQAHALRKWYDSEGFRLTRQSLSNVRGKGWSSARGKGSAAPWKLAFEVTSSDMEKTDPFMCKVTLMAIKGHHAVYKACTSYKCSKKVVDMGNGMYRCEKCATDRPIFKARLALQCHFTDFTDQFWVTCFNETGEVVLNEKGDTLGKLDFNRRDKFDVLNNKALFQQYIGKFRYKKKEVTVLELTPINHGEYAKQLLNEIRECSS